MAMPTIEDPKDVSGQEPSELERAAREQVIPSEKGKQILAAIATEPPNTTGGSGPLGRIGELVLALRVWLAGKPLSQRDRSTSATFYNQHNWANYW